MKKFFVGWDVGAWNCDQGQSRDAICVLSGETWEDLSISFPPWRNNLRAALISDTNVSRAILSQCGISITDSDELCWAIDTPLGWPEPFCRLLRGEEAHLNVDQKADSNPYLFRQTELWLFSKGFRPLSAVRDLIGSQSCKGIHFLRRSGLQLSSPGVWGTGQVRAIEAYPTPARTSPRLQAKFLEVSQNHSYRKKCEAGTNVEKDVRDALWCALIAALFTLDYSALVPPISSARADEGWIWIPTDSDSSSADEENCTE